MEILKIRYLTSVTTSSIQTLDFNNDCYNNSKTPIIVKEFVTQVPGLLASFELRCELKLKWDYVMWGHFCLDDLR